MLSRTSEIVASREIPATMPITRMITSQISPTITRTSTVFQTITPGEVVPGFGGGLGWLPGGGLPSLDFGGGLGIDSGSYRGRKQKRKYSPDVLHFSLGLGSKKSKSISAITGGLIRPIRL
jgi:hypothetical protein